MSSHPCSGPSCPNGNCIGCRNGNLWCQDPRCAPNCPGCQSNVNTWSNIVIIFVIIIGLILIGLVIWLYWRSNRPAKLTSIYPTSTATPMQSTLPNQPYSSIIGNPPVIGNVKVSTPIIKSTVSPVVDRTISAPSSGITTATTNGNLIGGTLNI